MEINKVNYLYEKVYQKCGKKTVYFTKKQLDEIEGANFAYLDNASSDFTNNKLNQTYASGTLDGHDADPITTDKVADMRAVDYGPWMPGGRGGLRNTLAYTNGMLCCSKKEWAEMNLISETNTQLVGRKIRSFR